MKANDIVEVNDGPYCKTLISGEIGVPDGYLLRNYRFRVLSFGAYPTNRVNSLSGTNDVMLVDVNDSDFVLFSQKRFCSVVSNPLQPERKAKLEVFVPRDTKNVHLVIE